MDAAIPEVQPVEAPPLPPPDYTRIKSALDTIAAQVVLLPNAGLYTVEQLRTEFERHTEALTETMTKKITEAVDALEQRMSRRMDLLEIKIHNYTCGSDSPVKFPPGVSIAGVPNTKNQIGEGSDEELDTLGNRLGLTFTTDQSLWDKKVDVMRLLGI